MKEFGPPGGASLAPPLDPPMQGECIPTCTRAGGWCILACTWEGRGCVSEHEHGQGVCEQGECVHGVCGWGSTPHTPSPETATEAGGTRPTGMHSSLYFVEYASI